MPRKSDGAKSYLSAESGGAAPAPVKRKRATRAKKPVAVSQPAEEAVAAVTAPEVSKQVVVEASSSVTPIDRTSEREEIERLAYIYWEARGGQSGSAEEDWLRAEQEVLQRRTNGAS
jgi:hypothetical protein